MLCVWICGLADLPARLSFLYLRCTNPSTAKPVNLIALARRDTIRLLPAFILAQQLISNIVGQPTKQAVHHYSYWHVFSLSSKASPMCCPCWAPLTILNSLLFLLSCISRLAWLKNFTCETDGMCCLSFFRFRWLWFCRRRLPDHLFPATLWRHASFRVPESLQETKFFNHLL
jgi:hypothetical protein